MSIQHNLIAKDLDEKGFDIIKQIGKGGFAEFFLINSRQYNKLFACKVIELSNEGRAVVNSSYDHELLALTSLVHDNIIQIYNTFRCSNRQYLILEYCSKGDLEHYIKKNGTIRNEKELLSSVLMILEPLKFLEFHNIAHNDIKPANILIDEHNKIKLSDFGLSQILQNDKLTSKQFAGSIPFLAPEILSKKEFNPLKSDVWAFGVTLYYIVTRALPFSYNSLNQLKTEQIKGIIYYPKTVSPFSRDLISKCLTIDPEKRLSFFELYQLVSVELTKLPAVPSIDFQKCKTTYFSRKKVPLGKHPKLITPKIRPTSSLFH